MTRKILLLQGYFFPRTYIRNFIYVEHRQSSKTFHVALMKLLYMHFVLLLLPRHVTLTSSPLYWIAWFLYIYAKFPWNLPKNIFYSCIFISVSSFYYSHTFYASELFFPDTNFLSFSSHSSILWETFHSSWVLCCE